MKFFYNDSGIFAHIDMQSVCATDIDALETLLRSFLAKARTSLPQQICTCDEPGESCGSPDHKEPAQRT